MEEKEKSAESEVVGKAVLSEEQKTVVADIILELLQMGQLL